MALTHIGEAHGGRISRGFAPAASWNDLELIFEE
jgi:hypothetical protein